MPQELPLALRSIVPSLQQCISLGNGILGRLHYGGPAPTAVRQMQTKINTVFCLCMSFGSVLCSTSVSTEPEAIENLKSWSRGIIEISETLKKVNDSMQNYRSPDAGRGTLSAKKKQNMEMFAAQCLKDHGGYLDDVVQKLSFTNMLLQAKKVR